MELFGKKQEAGKGSIPVREVESLRRSGMSDKDIIKKLKSEGYSYSEIEKGMLQSLKQNIAEGQTQVSADDVWTDDYGKEEAPSLEDVYGKPEEPKGPSLDEIMAPGMAESEMSPELAIEELVEGVVNEKWEVFEKELKKLRSDEEILLRQIRQLESTSSASGKDARALAFERKITEMEEKMKDLEARISGVEKAFKQFLPSLTENIRSLSNMVREMKGKTIADEIMGEPEEAAESKV